jgi:hypothetical protein
VSFVFGSWAQRHLGEPGATPRDIDVLVVGCPEQYDITHACLSLSGEYSIDVNPMIVSQDEFESRGTNAVLDEIVSGALVEVTR